MKRRRKERNLCDLPTEILLEIFNYLPRKDLLIVRKVNKEFKSIFSLTPLAKVYDSFFKFYEDHKKGLKERYQGGQEKEYEPVKIKDYQSLDVLITALKRLKWTLQAQEALEGILWDFEKHAHFKRHPPPKKKKKKKKKNRWDFSGEDVDEYKNLKRKDIQPIEERLYLNSTDKVNEFETLLLRLEVKSFLTMRCEGKDCYYGKQDVTFEFVDPKDPKNNVKVIAQHSISSTGSYQSLTAHIKFNNQEIEEELKKKNLVDIRNSGGWRSKRTKINLGAYFINDHENGTKENMFEKSNYGDDFVWEEYRTKIRSMKVVECFKNSMGLKFLETDTVAFILVILCFVFNEDLGSLISF